MFKEIRIALMFTLLATGFLGFLYPLAVTGIAQLVFPNQANGSLIYRDGKAVGSRLIGQPFDEPGYFWSRPSATSYNAAASAGSNLGPTNPALLKAVQERIAALRKADPENTAAVPVDLVTASGSGLDPHISPAAAQYQLRRVARARGISESAVAAVIEKYTQPRFLGMIGEPAVNVLELNLALEAMK